MSTANNRSCGFDLYIDSSGEDDWGIDTEKYYLHGLIACGPSDEWLQWTRIHKTEFDGMVHWSAGIFGQHKRKLENKKRKCRDLLAMHPWGQTVIYAFDKKAIKDFIDRKLGKKITKHELVERLWNIMGVSYLRTILPHMEKMLPNAPDGSLNIHEIIINNPKGGHKPMIENIIQRELDRKPKFVPAGHYGIDALDGVLWAFHRCLNRGATDCLPNSINAFAEDLNLVLLGCKTNKPIFLGNTSDIDDFRKAT
jgi:hypothetical protein